jgi:hypothetical protein
MYLFSVPTPVKKINPKFVVTLDGVDPLYLGDDGSESESVTKEMVAKTVGMVKPQRVWHNPVTIDLNDDGKDINDNGSVLLFVDNVPLLCHKFVI